MERCLRPLLILALSPIGLLCAQTPETPPPGNTTSTEAAPSQDALSELDEMLRVGDYREADATCARLGDAPAVLLRRARLLRETGRGGEALALLVAAAPYQAGDAGFLTRAAALREESGDRAGARKDLQSALAKEAGSIEARARLGLLLVRGGERAAGAEHLQKLLDFYKALDSEQAEKISPVDYVWLGRACEGLNRFSEAQKVMYESALDLDKNCLEAQLASGEIFLAKYNYPDARAFFKDAIAINARSAEAQIGLAAATVIDFQFPGDNRAAARAALKAADAVWKDHPRALELRGDLAFMEEDWSAAEGFYRRAIGSDPLDLRRQAALAAIHWVTSRSDEYRALCAEVERIHPRPAEFYARLAEILVNRFFYRDAAELAKKAIDIDPDYWPAYATFGINALRCNRLEEGREYLEKAWQADKFNVWVINTMTLLDYMDKNFIEKKTEHFVFRISREDAPFILPYMEPLLDEARMRFEREYHVNLSGPIDVEDFSDHKWFSARSIGLPGLAAAGVCFGTLVTLTTPKAIPENWGAVAVHEYAHVVTLKATKHRIPRWFTEGMSVFEEGRNEPRWRRVMASDFVDAVHHGQLLPMARLQSGFTNPDSPKQIMLSYFQGGQICQFIHDQWGFDKLLEMLAAYRDGLETEDVFRQALGVELPEFDTRFLQYARQVADSWGIWCRYGPEHIEPLRMAVDKDPKDIESWVKLGLAYYFTGKAADTELAVGKAMAIDPEHADLAALRGFLAIAQKKGKAAIPHLERALAKGSNYRYLAHIGLGILYAAEKDREQAVNHLREAIKIHPDGTDSQFGQPSPYELLAKILFELEREPEAIAVLEQLTRVHRTHLKSRLQVASYYRVQEEWGKLVNVLADAVFINPYDRQVHELLAEGYSKTDSYRSAIRELTVLQSFDNAVFDRIYAQMAWCYLKLGDRAQAEALAKKALALNAANERAKEVLSELGG